MTEGAFKESAQVAVLGLIDSCAMTCEFYLALLNASSKVTFNILTWLAV
jgi:hypothetical protein